MKTTQWKPDTHDAIVEFEWDETLPAEERTHTFKRFIKRPSGARYDAMTDQEVYDTLFTENKAKNLTLGQVLELLPDSAEEFINESGLTEKRFKEDDVPDFSINDAGELVITLKKSRPGFVKRALETGINALNIIKIPVKIH